RGHCRKENAAEAEATVDIARRQSSRRNGSVQAPRRRGAGSCNGFVGVGFGYNVVRLEDAGLPRRRSVLLGGHARESATRKSRARSNLICGKAAGLPSEIVLERRGGAKRTSSSDDVSALRAALSAAAGSAGRAPGKMAALTTPSNVTLPMRSPLTGVPLRQGSVSPSCVAVVSRVARNAESASAETPAPSVSARAIASSTTCLRIASRRSWLDAGR